MRKKLHWGGLAAVVGATTLVMPLLAMDSAQAVIPKADISITKTVASLKDPVVFDYSDTKSKGHHEWQSNGLHIWTEGTSGDDKVAGYTPTSTPLSDVGEPGLNFAASYVPPGPSFVPYIPGFQLVVDFDNDGTPDGILVGEPTAPGYGNDWWLSNGSAQFVKDAAPSHSGGFGSTNHGTLDQWRGVALFANAKVLAWGFSLGSGVHGDGVITGVTFAGAHYDFARDYESSLEAQPGETLEYKLTVTNAGAKPAANVKVTDALPAELTAVSGSLVGGGPDCGFNTAGKAFSCTLASLGSGASVTYTFKATLDDTISTAGMPTPEGHWVDVQKQETFADIPAGTDHGEYFAYCPVGYIATDGSLLLDAVDQGGEYSDVVVDASQVSTRDDGAEGWRIKASNLGDYRAQGKVHVTCLKSTVNTSGGHTHALDFGTPSGENHAIKVGNGAVTGHDFTYTCPSGFTPFAPVYEVVSGVVTVRESWAEDNVWHFLVDHDEGTNAYFWVSCLAPKTASSNGHQATLALTTLDDTISVGPEQRREGVMQCPNGGNGIVGGYAGYDASVLSLGKQPRGNNYMFRFYNEDWDRAWNADIQVTCVGVRTTDEPTYYHVVNTAYVTTTTKDRSADDNASSADVAVHGDPLAPPAGPMTIDSDVTRLLNVNGKVKALQVTLTCTKTTTCSFTVKVYDGSTVVASKTASIAAGNTKTVAVPTTSAGKNLAEGKMLKAKAKTTGGTTTQDVNITATLQP
jgi:uncharacterized repeat protein (TIGR01451 family)